MILQDTVYVKINITIPDAIRKALIGKRWVYTDGDRKYLDPVDAQLLVDKGWKWGIGPRKKRSKG